MSIQQKLNFRMLLNLLRQLKNYGLNPHDWRIRRLENLQLHELQMYHREDSDFSVRARIQRTERGEYILERLRIASL